MKERNETEINEKKRQEENIHEKKRNENERTETNMKGRT
jgi:hypothetical protein